MRIQEVVGIVLFIAGAAASGYSIGGVEWAAGAGGLVAVGIALHLLFGKE